MTNPYVPAKISIVVTEPGFGDLSMADQVLTGLEELGGDIVVDIEYFTATDQGKNTKINLSLYTWSLSRSRRRVLRFREICLIF